MNQTVFRVVNYKSNARVTKNKFDTEEVFQKNYVAIIDNICKVVVSEYKMVEDFFNEEPPDSEVYIMRKFTITRNERFNLEINVMEMEGNNPVFEKKEFKFKQKHVELGNIFKRIEDQGLT